MWLRCGLMKIQFATDEEQITTLTKRYTKRTRVK